MKPLEPPDSNYLAAAEGWLALGNLTEAEGELEKIAPSVRSHPRVLMTRLMLCIASKKWPECIELANALVRVMPNDPLGWIRRSYALHCLTRTREAFAELLPAADMFPDEWAIPYNLARYATQLGDLKTAGTWLKKAFDAGDAKKIKLMALDDPDLEALWADTGDI